MAEKGSSREEELEHCNDEEVTVTVKTLFHSRERRSANVCECPSLLSASWR